ncbi:uncharacterized protein METZ01_LOCUS45836 [marine metagenome]|uniref:Uncharacterized protein n=1 Tax=marine metagenome TaxID=408172 RepID=A0A381RMB1_9ZZZZ
MGALRNLRRSQPGHKHTACRSRPDDCKVFPVSVGQRDDKSLGQGAIEVSDFR